MKVIVAGSRSITDKQTVYDAIEEFKEHSKIDEIVCGMATGVDLLGRDYGHEHGIHVKEFPVLPSERWKGGPAKRNQRMADYAKASEKGALLLVWDGLSSGSKDMLARARKAGLYIMVIDLSQPRLL